MRKLIFLFLLSACTTTAGDDDPPVTPVTPVTPLAVPPPTNLRAIAGDRQVTLLWDEPVGASITGYTIHVSERTIPVPAPALGFIVTGLSNGVDHTFSLSATDASGRTSARSSAVSARPVAPRPPELIGATPGNGFANVAVDSSLTLVFSQAMSTASLQVNLSPSVALQAPAWADLNTRATIAPAVPLAAGTRYTVTVNAKDEGGHALAPVVFSFTTAHPAPDVRAFAPAPDAQNVPTTTSISVEFTTAMDRAATQAAITLSPAVSCAWSWDAGSRLATCAPAARLAGFTYHVVTVSTAARSAAGIALAAPRASPFQTGDAGDVTPPTVDTSNPFDGATGISTNRSLMVFFSEPMDKASAQDAFAILSPASQYLFTFSWDETGTVMIVDPLDPWYIAHDIVWTVRATAKDLAGNALSQVGLPRQFRTVRRTTYLLFSEADLDGTAGENNHLDRLSPRMNVGDILEAQRYGWLSFDLSAIPDPGPGVRLVSATVSVYQEGVIGDPYAVGGMPDAVYIDHTVYGTSLEAPDYPSGQFLGANKILSASGSIGWYAVDFGGSVATDLANRAARNGRSQFRIRNGRIVRTDNASAATVWTSGEPTAVNKPTLVLVFEQP